MIGQTVGNYRITRLLGQGGMGTVYLAEHPGIGRKAAVKVLHPHLTQDAQVANRFFNEARAANAIGHHGIVQVLDFGSFSSGATYIVMEFLEGESLASRIRRGRLPIAHGVEIVLQTAAALGAAHVKSIVHRDLKPDNLYLTPDPQTAGRDVVKVLDFGIAKLGAGPSGYGSVKTRTGAVMGTPVYMSPEQCRGTKEVDHRSDIYALGVILYELICGTPPFVSEGQGEVIYMQIGDPPPSPRGHNPEIPEALERVVLRTLEKDPARRFQSMGELSQALQGLAVPATIGTQVYPGNTLVYPGGDVAGPKPSRTTLSEGAGVLERKSGRPGRWRVVSILAGVVVAAVGGTFLIVGRVGTVNPNRVADLPKAGEAERARPAASLAAAASVPVPAPAPAPIVVGVTSTPPGARVVRERDGAVLGLTPLRTTWPQSVGVEGLRVELEGYKPELVVVPLDRGGEVALPLKRVAAQMSRRKRATEAASTSSPPSPSTAPAAPATAPPVPAKPARPEPVPL